MTGRGTFTVWVERQYSVQKAIEKAASFIVISTGLSKIVESPFYGEKITSG